MEFWRLAAPEYESDYHEVYINGGLEHPYGLPGVNCDVCGETWGGTRSLPFECPEHLRSRRELTDAWPIPGPAHRALRSEISAYLGAVAGEAIILRPGDDFQPAFLDVPSKPKADFLWASVGSVVLSDRIRTVLYDLAGDRVMFAPVFLRNIGALDPDAEPPAPDSGEPEDLFDEVEYLEDTSQVGPYWELIVRSESGLPAGVTEIIECAGCGRPIFDQSSRVLVMNDAMWTGSPIFTFATTLWTIVTEDIRNALLELRATNVAFETPSDAARDQL